MALSSVARAGKCLRTVMEVCDNFDSVNHVHSQSGKHSGGSIQADLALVVKELHEKSEVFKEAPGRRHRSFPTTRRNRYGSIDWNIFQSGLIQRRSFLWRCTLTLMKTLCVNRLWILSLLLHFTDIAACNTR